MKIEWNNKYLTISVYAVLVIAAGAATWAFFDNFIYFKDRFLFAWRLLQPFLYGFVIAYILNPCMKMAEKRLLKNIKTRKTRRFLSVGITYLITFMVMGLAVWIIIPQVADSISQISRNLNGYTNGLDVWVRGLVSLLPNGQIPQELIDMLDQFLERMYGILGNALPFVINSFNRVTSGVYNFVMGIIISMYMLADKERFMAQTKKIFFAIMPQQTVESILHVAHDGNKKFSGFISGKLLDSLIIGILCFIGMSIFRMPYSILVSVIVGVTNVVPYFGPFIGAIPSFLFILTTDPIKALWFLVFILFLQQLDGNVIGPKILGDSTGLSAFWVIFAILFFGGEMGFFGMLIGVPLFAVIYTVIKGVVQYRLWKKGLPVETQDYASAKHGMFD